MLLGAIADDFTGATDLANTLVKEGMRVVQVIGVPDETTDVGEAEAVVVALKSRTAPVDNAVGQSLAALELRDASLIRLLQSSDKGIGLISLDTVRDGPEAIRTQVDQLRREGISYGVIDALTDDDLRLIGAAAIGHSLITGGSGVATGLPDNFRSAGLLAKAHAPVAPTATGRELVLAGSCSTATHGQIAHTSAHWPTTKIDVDEIAAGVDVISKLSDWAIEQPVEAPVLIYDSADPDEVAATQAKYGLEKAGAMVENVMGGLVVRLRVAGFKRLVVAGGETSGAVVTALEISSLRIGPEIAPGVPWTEALGDEPLALALKSGNFGKSRFFEPTKEAFLHTSMYDERPKAGAIVHLHSTHSVAVSCMHDIDHTDVLPPLTAYYVMRVGKLPLVSYFPPGDVNLANAVREMASDHHAVLLANHGPVVAGKSLEDAVYATEELEETARLFLALQGMKTRPLTQTQVAEIRRRFPAEV